MKRYLSLFYGIATYAIFNATFLYLVGFLGDFIVPKSLDSAPQVVWTQALIINLGLITLFGVQHSVMARPWFKKMWTKIVPEHLERSTYVLFSSFALMILLYFWEPMGGTIWYVENTVAQIAIYSVFGLGWVLLLLSTFSINHFDLFGLRQVYLNFINKPYTDVPFREPVLYKMVRHPLYLGFVFGVWATPHMTIAHLVLALGFTVYILVGIHFEEKDLIRVFGDTYRKYKSAVPKLIPLPR